MITDSNVGSRQHSRREGEKNWEISELQKKNSLSQTSSLETDELWKFLEEIYDSRLRSDSIFFLSCAVTLKINLDGYDDADESRKDKLHSNTWNRHVKNRNSRFLNR